MAYKSAETRRKYERAAARGAPQKYGVHLHTCRARDADADQRDCDCGFARAHLDGGQARKEG